jgi:O-antigen/teichoic acid export membrane protein
MVNSAGWAAAGDVLTALCGAAGLVIAARFVPKAEIGLVGVVMLLLALLEALTTSGVEQALVQRTANAESSLDAAWTWQFGRGIAIGAAVALASPLIASFYGAPALAPLACALAVQPVLRGATNIALVLRVRELDFRAQFVVTLIPALFRVLAVIPLSLLWRNAWALVVATLAEHAVRLLLSFVLHPRWPALCLRWSELAPLLRFGRWITGLSIMAYLTTRGDDLFVSKQFGAADLATYQLAFGFANAPVTAVAHVFGRVSFPAFARLHDQSAQLRSAFLEVLRVATVASFVTSVALYFALPFLPVVVGPQWHDAIAIGRVLAIAGAVRSLAATGGPLFQGTGRPDLDVRMNLPRLAVLVLLITPLSGRLGLLGVSFASLASVCACLPVWLYGTRVQAGVSVVDLAAVLWRSLLAAALAAAAFATVALLVPRDLVGLALFAVLGSVLTYAGIRACERVSGVAVLPSLSRIKAL